MGAAGAQELGRRSWAAPGHCRERADAGGSYEVVGQALPSLQIAHHVSTVGITWGE